jgi:putative ABC transport system permease protein
MTWTHRIRTGLAGAGHAPDEDVVEELAQHARAMYETARAEGAAPEEADQRVVQQIALWAREAPRLQRRPRRAPVVEPPAPAASRLVGVAHDLRYAVRLLWRHRGATLLSMLTMALGVGATTVLFSVAWGVLFKPLPWPDAHRLVRVSEMRQGATRRLPPILTNGTYLAWRESQSTIEEIGGWSPSTVTFTGTGSPQRIRIAAVTPSVFPLLRAGAAIGTLFNADPQSDRAVVLSFSLWQQQFGGSPEALGRAIQLDGATRTIVAVMPRAFVFPDRDVRAWVPMRVRPVIGENPETRFVSLFSAMARLRPGVTPAQAAAEGTARGRGAPDPGLTAIALFGSRGPVDVSAVPVLEAMTGDVRQALILFLVAVGLLLATATANVAGVQLARSTTRGREIAIRSALGAGSGRIARQLLIENVLLGVMGGLVGLIAAYWLHQALPAVLPADFPRALEVTLDVRVMAFAIAVSVAASIAVGLLPALHARRVNLVEALTDDGLAPAGGSTRTKTARARAVIMAGQVAVASVLLVEASLLIRSFVAMLNVDRGYDVTNVLTARVPLPAASYSGQRRAVLLERILERLRATPGVTQAAVTTILPLGSSDSVVAFGLPPSGGSGDPVQVQSGRRTVSPSYFAAMGMRIVEGRPLTVEDTQASLPVVVVNRTFARRYLDDAPLGRRLPAGLDADRDEQLWHVVGVVEDVQMQRVTDLPTPEIFVSFAQLRSGVTVTDPALVVRTSGDAAAFVPQLRHIVRQQDASVALDAVETMEQRLLGNLARPRLYALLLGGFAVVALAIATVGLFGVLSYTVAQRSREIAVRSALGARPIDIVVLVVGQGIAITGIGLVAGVAAALILTRSISTFLYGVTTHDRVTFTAVPLLLLAAAAIACYVPARRAANLDPQQVLRGS